MDLHHCFASLKIHAIKSILLYPPIGTDPGPGITFPLILVFSSLISLSFSFLPKGAMAHSQLVNFQFAKTLKISFLKDQNRGLSQTETYIYK
jgi:hypothetical protein